MPSGTLVVLLRALCFANLHRVSAAITTGVGDDPGTQAAYRPMAKRQRQQGVSIAAQAEAQATREHAMLDDWGEVARIAGIQDDLDAQPPAARAKKPANNPQVERFAKAPAAQTSAPTNKPQAASRQAAPRPRQMHANVPAQAQVAPRQAARRQRRPPADIPAQAFPEKLDEIDQVGPNLGLDDDLAALGSNPQAASKRGRLPRADADAPQEQPAIPVLPNLMCPPEIIMAEDYEEEEVPVKGGTPVIMQRGGKYGHNSPTQRRFLKKMEPAILRGVREGAVVLDLGCADGINSMHILKAIKNQAFNFTMAFVDLPGNDWGTVRKTVSNVIMDVFPKEGGAGKPGVMDKVLGMFGSKVTLIGESFFKQVAPSNTVNVAFSSTALHYLSVENIGLDRAKQAAQDWESFLHARSRELVAGGRLHITALASTQQGVNPGAVWDVMNNVLSEAVLAGIITIPQRMSWQWPAYARTEDEWRAPFDQGKFPRLKMESFDIVLADTPYWAQAHGNACVFSALYVPSVMAWIEPHLRRTFPRPLIDLFRRRLKASVEVNPERFKPDLFQGMMIIRKTGGPPGAMSRPRARGSPQEPALHGSRF